LINLIWIYLYLFYCFGGKFANFFRVFCGGGDFACMEPHSAFGHLLKFSEKIKPHPYPSPKIGEGNEFL
jgi:hypothetical protein